jgi:hypothetical protein
MRIQFIGGPKHKHFLQEVATRQVLPFIDVELDDQRRTRYLLKSWVTEGSEPSDRERDLERVYAWEQLSDQEFHELAAQEARTRAP